MQTKQKGGKMCSWRCWPFGSGVGSGQQRHQHGFHLRDKCKSFKYEDSIETIKEDGVLKGREDNV